MKPVDQTKFGNEGNCFAACIASILEIPLQEVPDLAAAMQAKKNFRRILADWLHLRGLTYVELEIGKPNWSMGDWNPPTYHIIGGDSPRGVEGGHAVVGYAGTMVHDPHPSRAGVSKVTDWSFFIRLFPENK